MSFKYGKLRWSYGSFPRNWPKCPFWAKNGIFGPKLAQNGPNRIFQAKSKNVTSVALGALILCQILENFYERIPRCLSNGRTYVWTEMRMWIYRFLSYCGEPKIGIFSKKFHPQLAFIIHFMYSTNLFTHSSKLTYHLCIKTHDIWPLNKSAK